MGHVSVEINNRSTIVRSALPAATDRKHVFAIMVQFDVMATAQPTNVQGFVISIMMGVDLWSTADFAALLH